MELFVSEGDAPLRVPSTLTQLILALPALAPEQIEAPCSARAVYEEPHAAFRFQCAGDDPGPAIAALWAALRAYSSARSGPIYWRSLPEVSETATVIFHPNGPDFVRDFVTEVNGMGWTEKRWVAYARLTRSDLPIVVPRDRP